MPSELAEALAETRQRFPMPADESRAGAVRVLAALDAAKSVVDANVDELGRIDAIAGDGDHGIGMRARRPRRGQPPRPTPSTAAPAPAPSCTWPRDAWADKAGGTSGALWGMALRAVGGRARRRPTPPTPPLSPPVSPRRSARIMDFGKAKVGDKTLVDVLVPFSDALTAGVRRRPDPAAGLGRGRRGRRAGRRSHRRACCP